ncbi:DUF418 domain-containing protein [Amycolatopsis taiwanensis]|uniref:DUF418 domain-containing protein n=1 Tax=Amycolatopsis taiwanensis TaxID=342230 RepID=UPI000481A1F4|nr:DUF418 domain-containing protein [Amycolatopsis taiwanensis]
MTTNTEAPPGRGPVRRGERALAPDLARGAMLLIIALANVAGVVFAGEPGAEPAPEGADRGVNLIMFTLLHARGYPVFAVMFGYGLVQLARRQRAAGASPAGVRSVLLRRNGWLVVFGFVHAALLYYGDFLGAYGLVGIVMTLVLLNRNDRVHKVVLWLWGLATVEVLVLGIVVAIRILSGEAGTAELPLGHVDSLAAPDYGRSVLDRLTEWPVHTLTVLPFILITWLGMWAARRGVLENPAAHRQLLRWTVVIGLGISTLGGLPMGLASAGWLHVDESTASLMSYLHGGTGMFAGPGFVALFGLIALRVSRKRKRGSLVVALCALGQRSLSGYLFQSVAWIILLAPYTLDLGNSFATKSIAGVVIAFAVWLISVVVARMLDRLGKPGPAEWVLRRLAYGRRS